MLGLTFTRISLATYLKISALVIAIMILKFTLSSSQAASVDGNNLELVITDFNKRPIDNAQVFLYASLKDYRNDKPMKIDNWEQSQNHYSFEKLSPHKYYFRVLSASLDNSSDIISTAHVIDKESRESYKVVLK